MYNLLIHCARIECTPGSDRQLAQATHQFRQWEQLIEAAEGHGLGPLLYRHLQTARVTLPPAARRALQGLYLRHRRANQVRAQVLKELLLAYQSAGIQALALKGAALSHLIYPQPGLRPMRDLDILVAPAKARQAQSLLAELGFHAPLPNGKGLPSKHLAAAVRHQEGLMISVEVHHDAFHDDFPASLTLDRLISSPLTFPLDGLTAYTLGYEEMLWHLCLHIVNMAHPLRLIWVADIVGFAEKFAAKIDWQRVKRTYPQVLHTLSLFHFITPLSEALQGQAPLSIGKKPSGIGEEFRGWPRMSLGNQKEKGYTNILHDTFFPSEWWLRMYYGLGSAGPLFWHRWLWHPTHILGLVKQLLFQRLRRRISGQR